MPGGLLNLVAYGNENIILNENPSKTFFKSVYRKYTNFGLQTFRLDHVGTNSIQENVKSTFKFKVKRYGDLLHDTYLSITLPDIYGSGPLKDDGTIDHDKKYNFKWIKHLGYSMIDEVVITIGGQLINKYSGEYLLMLQEQFQSDDKISHLNEMTGNTDDLNDPEENIKKYYNYAVDLNSEQGTYKVSYYPCSGSKSNSNQTLNEPSIKGKKLYIPINAWFGNTMKQALPLVSLQYHEVDIIVTLKAVKDLYLVQNRHTIEYKDNVGKIYDPIFFCDDDRNRLDPQPNIKEQFDYGTGTLNKTYKQFLSTVPQTHIRFKYVYNYVAPEENNDTITFDMFIDGTFRNWNPDIHLVSTFVFLSEDERALFAKDNHNYLIKICYEQEFLGLVGNHSASINLNGLITDIFWRYRRSDANKRNEWTNYSNIKYYNRYNYFPITKTNNRDTYETQSISDNEETNDINILKKLEIMFDGKIREESFDENIFRCLQKYRTKNTFTRDLKQLYYYSFGLEEGLEDLQPSGAVNTSKFKDVSFIFETIDTPRNPEVDTSTLVKYIPTNENSTIPFNVVLDNAASNQILAEDTTGTCVPVFDKQFRQEKLYTFDLKICSRKYNILTIHSGMGGLKYAR